MIRIQRILVNCAESQLTVENHTALESLRIKLASELNITTSQITLTYEEPDNNEQN